MMGPPLGETRSKLDSYDFNNIVAGSHPFKAKKLVRHRVQCQLLCVLNDGFACPVTRRKGRPLCKLGELVSVSVAATA
jgi:hypothetical protein